MSRLINCDGALQFYRKPSGEITRIVIINTTVVQVSGICVFTEVTLAVSWVGLPARITELTLPASLPKDTIVYSVHRGHTPVLELLPIATNWTPHVLTFPYAVVLLWGALQSWFTVLLFHINAWLGYSSVHRKGTRNIWYYVPVISAPKFKRCPLIHLTAGDTTI